MLKALFCCPRAPGIIWFIGVIPLFVVDQMSKWLIVHSLSFQESIHVFPGLRFILGYNYGIAFSLLNEQTPIKQLLLLTSIFIICLMVAIWLARTVITEKLMGVSLTLILGGALGNLCDRIWHGYVIDFIDFYVGNWHWYTFNLADCFITIGGILMVIHILLTPSEK